MKLLLLAVYGPILQPDTAGYLYIVDRIQDGSPVFSEVPDWSTSPVPPLAFRTYGYPLLILVARWVGGHDYGYLLVLVQIALTLWVARLLFVLSRALSGSTLVASIVLVCHLSGQTVLWDQCILTDSIYGSLFNIVILKLAESYYQGRMPSPIFLSLLGLVWGYAIFVRDSGLYFTVIPCLFLLFLRESASRPSPARRLRRLLAFLVPLAVMGLTYTVWNDYRTGEIFFSITGVANFMRPAFDLARAGVAAPFAGPDAVSAIVRANLHDFSFAEQLDILQKLHDGLGLTSPLALQSLVMHQYLQTVSAYPLEYAWLVLRNMDLPGIAGLLFDPLDSFNAYFQLGIPPYLRVVPALTMRQFAGLARSGDATILALGLAALVAKALSIAALLSVLTVIAGRSYRERRAGALSRETRTALLLLASCLVVIGFFALVHTEDRLRLPFVPSALVASAYAFSRWRSMV